MAPKPDIGWEFAHIVGDNQKIIICKFCGKTINGGITRFKEHIALVSGNVQKKELGLESIQQSVQGLESESSGEDASEDIETQQLRKALKESRNTRAFEEEMHNQYGQGFIGSSSSSGSNPGLKKEMHRSFKAGPGIKGPSGRQIGGVFLEEEVDEINGYLNALKSKWSNSVDCTNKSKTADFILSLMNKVIDEIGEENVVQVVTDSEGAMKAAGARLMMERPHLFWSPCAAHCLDLILEDVGKMQNVKKCIEKAKQITSFIYNSDKVVNLMKTFTNDRELLRPGITRFAT
ncbi:uncharacterized protein [Primulina eburnea]|uniref:uncharacterized protein n=1 Tax=Primulina eburnea TaxID=1245227 RepID=UPI003C6C3526